MGKYTWCNQRRADTSEFTTSSSHIQSLCRCITRNAISLKGTSHPSLLPLFLLSSWNISCIAIRNSYFRLPLCRYFDLDFKARILRAILFFFFLIKKVIFRLAGKSVSQFFTRSSPKWNLHRFACFSWLRLLRTLGRIYPVLYMCQSTRASLSPFSSYFVSRANRFPLPYRFCATRRDRTEHSGERVSIYGAPNERVVVVVVVDHPNATQKVVRGWNQFSTVSI